MAVSTDQRTIIAITESHRGQGIGAGLVREALRCVKGRWGRTWVMTPVFCLGLDFFQSSIGPAPAVYLNGLGRRYPAVSGPVVTQLVTHRQVVAGPVNSRGRRDALRDRA
jgi:GNAT superfamily N-acetyltransferase